jgi:hypothetical protein
METIDYRGHIIKTMQDDDPIRPDEWDTESFLVYDHHQFCVKKKGFDPDDIFEHMKTGKSPLYDGYWFFPVFAYIHSGVSLSLGRSGWPFNCPFDTSFKGFCLVKRVKGWSWTREKAMNIAEGTVEMWDDYCQGNVYGFMCETIDGESLDSCWGYYGNWRKSGILDEAKSTIDYRIKSERASHFKQLKTWIKNHVPLFVRQPMPEEALN